MKKFYVIGSKASNSLSPIIFKYWFNKYKIKATYKYLQLNNNNFDLKINTEKTVQDAIRSLKLNKDDLVVITGSLYLVGEVLKSN